VRVALTVWGWPTHYFHVVPLAWALRAAGHDVRVLTQPSMLPVVVRSGLPGVAVGPPVDVEAMRRGEHYMAAADPAHPLDWQDMRKYGTWTVAPYLVTASTMLEDCLRVTSSFRPDLIVYEATSYVGPVVSAVTGIPAVRHTWGVDYPYLFEEFTGEAFAPFAKALGVPAIDTLGVATVDTCPPSMQLPVADGRTRLPMRFVPYNGTARAPAPPPRPGGPHVVVCWGVTVGMLYDSMFHLRGVVESLGALDAEVTVAIGDPAPLGPLPANVRTLGGYALHDLLAGADLLICQGGMGNLMTALAAGVPSLTVPGTPDQVCNGRQHASTGAGRCVPFDPDHPDEITRHAGEMLIDPGYRERAIALRDESIAMPAAHETVATLATLI